MSANGPANRAVCRILNQNSCGSGSICGNRGGKLLILTNAHVAGTRVGRIVKVWIESINRSIDARVIMAAYSDRTLSDWAVLESTEEISNAPEPVKLSKKMPRGSHYTKGFPRCQQHGGTDVVTVEVDDDSPLWRWRPNSIGGQSGSAVCSDEDDLQYGLLTWSWGGLGAGQTTAMIYIQARARSHNVGPARVDGLSIPPMDGDNVDWEFPDGLERTGDDPTVEEGFYQEADIDELPIWDEGKVTPPAPDAPEEGIEFLKDVIVEYFRKAEEVLRAMRTKVEGGDVTVDQPKPKKPEIDDDFGMG